MRDLVRQHRRLFLLLTVAAVALRLFFIFMFPVTQGDTLIYGDIAKNWLSHGVFGQTINGDPEPTLIRLPGYPAFLAVCFTLFGSEHYNAVRFVQLMMDVAGCFVVADLTRRIAGNKAALWAFGLAALCPFTANYVALPLAETPSIFCTVLAFWFAVRGLDSGRWREWVGCGAATGAGILLRPDNGIVLAVIGTYVMVRSVFASHPTMLSGAPDTERREQGTADGEQRNRQSGNGDRGSRPLDRPSEAERARFKSEIRNRKSGIQHAALAMLLMATIALAPLIPWTLRNWRVFHVFQPLAARYANNPDEDPHPGFQQWTKTWMGEYVSVVEVYWHVTGEEVDASLLPSRAFDTSEERQKTFEIFEQYNEANAMPPQLDLQFAELARERKRHSAFRYYVWLPAARVADMWLRPRTEMLGIMERWWEYWNDPVDFGTALAYGLLNLAYVAVAVWGMTTRRLRYGGMLLAFVVVRSLFLGTLENPEPRYTLEMFPVLMVFAGARLGARALPSA